MEILFENKYTRDKEWAKDINSYIWFRRPIIIVLDIIFALYILIGIYNSITSNVVDWFYILIPIIWCVFVAFIYRKNVNTVIKRDLELHGKAIEVTVTVAEDIIKQSQSTGSEFQLNYCDIKKVVQTKKYIYLWSKTNMLYSFKRNSFSFGAADEFLLFLKNKGIKVK
ncbi:MAG: hypothetical protein IKY33_03235 [Clostridia bacterium]|nr:hypothetical protein [Clostridia bacterium]